VRVSRATWATTVVVALSLALAMALGGGADVAAPPAEGDVLAPVRVLAMGREALSGEAVAGGFLRAKEDVTVSAERAGRVVSIPVPEGAAVRRGEAVVHLDDTLAAASLEQARAAAREAALDPDRPAAELAATEEALRRAAHELALHHPASPLDGVVEVHHVDAGEFVAPGTPLVDVLDARVLILDIDVDAEVVGFLRPGIELPVRVPSAGPEGTASGRITRVAGRAHPRTRRFRVEISIEERGGPLRPGMHADASIPLPPAAPSLYLPKSAVRRLRGEWGAYVVRDGLARWTPVGVEEIPFRPDLWRVRDGALVEGEEVVVSGFSGLRDGARVEVLR